MDKKKYLPLLLLLFCVTASHVAFAQLTISGQVRTRTELDIVKMEEYKITRERLLSLLMDKVEIDERISIKK